MIPSRTGSALRCAAPKKARNVLARGAHKEVKFSNEGRAAMLAGVDTLAKAVSVTLGPKGQFLIRAPCFERVVDTFLQAEMSSLSRALVAQRSQKVCRRSFIASTESLLPKGSVW